MQQFEQRHGLTFDSLRDDDGRLYAHFGVPLQPAWVFVDAAGKATVVPTSLEAAELRDRLDALVAA